ncbi:MAG: DNA-methyltransferase [Acidobacteriota bacterium]
METNAARGVSVQQDQPQFGNAIWQSSDGRSRLYHGDCLEVMASMQPDSVDCIWTDPPYNLSNDGITCVAGRMVKVNKGEWDRSRGVELDHEFNKAWLAACRRVLKPNGTIWVSGTLHVYPSVGFAMQQLGFRILNDIIWEKPAPPPNLGCRCFTHSTELILWATKAKKGKDKYTFNYEDMKTENADKQMKNVWRMSAPSKAEKRHGKHPTQKPVELIARCLRASTNVGDLVLDPFAGAATTGVAAFALQRHFVGIEMDKGHAELATRRLASAVGDYIPRIGAEKRDLLWSE